MNIKNIRQDSVNVILATSEDGKVLAFHNADETEITAMQLEGVRKGRTIEAATAQGLVFVERE